MTLDIRSGNLSLRDLLAGPPRVTDSMEAVCRTLELPVQNPGTLDSFIGKPIELWYGGKRWFYGNLFRRTAPDTGQESYAGYDPLIYLKRNPDDYYIKNMTATQSMQYLARLIGLKTGKMVNTGAVFKALYYPGAEPDKVAIDLLARTAKANGKKYWFRYQPDYGADGLILFERTVPNLVWAFQTGVNLTAANLEESLEETVTIIKLVNRETGKTVTKINTDMKKKYGPLKHFEEVDKDKAKTMEKDAQTLLDEKAKLNTIMTIEGVNPNRIMPQFFSGDVIYVEERRTRILGAYYIKDITHTFSNDNLVQISAEITKAPDVPDIQYEDATQVPDFLKGKKKSKKAQDSLAGLGL